MLTPSFNRLARLRLTYWFWPTMMTVLAAILGVALPFLDFKLGPDWTAYLKFLRTTEVEGARAILTTLASATLGVAGVAFSITIVAVSFASSNYGPRLIGNFMGDRINQVVLGIFVASFVYCVTVLTTVHGRSGFGADDIASFVPQISIYFSMFLMLLSVGALIVYIHHIPESINIMNLSEKIGRKLRQSIISMLDEEVNRDLEIKRTIDISSWRGALEYSDQRVSIRTTHAGYLQQFDILWLNKFALEHNAQIILERSPGDFVSAQEVLMSVRGTTKFDDDVIALFHSCYTLGAVRTDVQDVLFLSDQLVEVLARALSPGVNDPHTAMLCLDWLRAALAAFSRRAPSQPTEPGDPVLYNRVTFDTMLDRSFDRMRQYISADRTVTLYTFGTLADIAIVALHEEMATACARHMRQLATSALEVQQESLAKQEIEVGLADALEIVTKRRSMELGEGTRDLN